jgi:predicted RNase H-like HicB family nuclease
MAGLAVFEVLIERDEDGWLVATVPALRGCHTQARSFDELALRIDEAVKLCVELER